MEEQGKKYLYAVILENIVASSVVDGSIGHPVRCRGGGEGTNPQASFALFGFFRPMETDFGQGVHEVAPLLPSRSPRQYWR
jgi:hypothetical protein